MELCGFMLDSFDLLSFRVLQASQMHIASDKAEIADGLLQKTMFFSGCLDCNWPANAVAGLRWELGEADGSATGWQGNG